MPQFFFEPWQVLKNIWERQNDLEICRSNISQFVNYNIVEFAGLKKISTKYFLTLKRL